MVTFFTKILGYKEGELTGNKDNNKFEIILLNGIRIWLNEDEFIR